MKNKFFLTYVLSEVYAILDKKQKKGVIILFIGIFINGILDLVGLAAILGVLSLAVSPEKIYETPIVNDIYELLGFTETNSFVIFVITCLLGIFVFKTIVGIFIIYQQKNYAFEVTEGIVNRMYAYYFHLDPQELKKIDTGNQITNIRIVPVQYVTHVLQPLILLLSEIFVAASIVLAIAFINAELLLLLGVIIGIAFILIYRTTRNRVYELGKKVKVIGPETLRIVTEDVMGQTTIQLQDKVPFFRKKYIKKQHKEYILRKWMSFFNEIPSRVNEFLMVSGIFLLFLYGIIFFENIEELQVMIGMLAVSAYRIMPSLNRMLTAMVSMKKGQYLIEILEVLKTVPTEMEEEAVEKGTFHDEIVLSNLSFSFDDGEQIILDGINFSVKKGDQIGLIGESGSGKTTMMKILLRILEEKEGFITVDGKKLTKENRKSWQKNIGYVQQDIFLVDGTLAENIAFGFDKDEMNAEKIAYAVKMAHLDAFMNELPDGVNTYIGEFGSKLSGGQKQRLAIARAIYTEAEIFIFDEATSALDAETEHAVTESLSLLKEKGKTCFIIAHRYTTLKKCDIIYELEDGKITKEYKYQELIKEKLGLVEKDI